MSHHYTIFATRNLNFSHDRDQPSGLLDGCGTCVAKQIEPYSAPRQSNLAPEPAELVELDRRITELHCRVLAISASAETPSGRLRELFARLPCDILLVAW